MLYIVIPAYNEESNIKKVVDDWHKIALKYNGKLLVVNDGSKDNTLNILNSLNYSNLIVLDKPNGGHGSAIIAGYKYALNYGADYIFQTDSDGQTNPEDFRYFWKNRHKYDMIIGYRKYRQDGLSRIIVTKILKLVIISIFKVKVRDANTPFRLMKADFLTECLKHFDNNYNLPNVIISVIGCKNYKVLSKTITFKPRQGGKNSINIRKIIKIGIKALKDFKTIQKDLL